MKLLWIDTETTGLNKERCDIVQVAGIVIIDGVEKERFNFRCQPINYENIEPVAFEHNNLSIDILKTYPMPQVLYANLTKLLNKYIDRYNPQDKFFIAGHNVQFDVDFLRNFFIKMGDNFFGSYFYYRTVDLMYFATLLHTAGLINLTSWKLGDIANYLGIVPDGNLHDAEADIDLTRKCFCRLVAKYINFGYTLGTKESNIEINNKPDNTKNL